MNISKRLNQLAEMVTEGNRLADVGTDHGYVPICLCEREKIPSAIAMDINEGPLARAQAHIREAGLQDRIETRLSDGLAALRPCEADTVLIAGMGGPLTVRILTEGRETLRTVKELVLSPQSEVEGVRRWLKGNFWKIVQEDMVREEGKYYPMFRAVPVEKAQGADLDCSEAEARFGDLRLQKSPSVLAEYLEKRLTVYQKIYEKLPVEGGEKLERRKAEIERELRLLKSVRAWPERSEKL